MYKKLQRIATAALMVVFLHGAQNASAITLTQLEPQLSDAEKIELVTPESGYDFAANFLDQNLELKYQATITNNENYPIAIDSISLTESEHNFLEYSYDGIATGDELNIGESRTILISVKTNDQPTSSATEDYALNFKYHQITPSDQSEGEDENEDEAEAEVPLPSTVDNVVIIAIVFAALSIVAFCVLRKNSRGRHLVILFALPLFSALLLSRSASASNSLTFAIRGKIRFISTYIITVNPNGGNYSGETIAKLREGEVFRLAANPTRDTYSFAGWTASPETEIIDNTIVADHDYTITANWEEIYHTVTVDPNGGSYAGELTQQIRDGGTFHIGANPTRATYTFQGWQTIPNGLNPSEDIVVTSDITFKALWNENYFQITVDPNGGIYNNQTAPYVESFRENDTVTMGTPTREHYRFAGWKIGNHFIQNNQFVVAQDATVTATWEQIYHHISIDPNGGEYNNSPSVFEQDYPEATELTIANPTRTHYRFTGWTATPNIIDSDGKLTVSEDVSLKANWEEIKFTLTINPNGGDYAGHTASFEREYQEGTEITISTPTRGTYDFAGWDIQGDAINNSKITLTQNTVITAQWNEIFYTLTIDPNGGSYGSHESSFSEPRRANSKVCVDNPTRATYSFTGWTIDVATLDSENCFIITENTTMSANWEEIFYTLTIDPNGGNYANNPSGSYRAGTTVDLAEPSYTGHTFAKWLKNGEDFIGTSINMTEDITLVAQWDDVYFDVTVSPNGGSYNGFEGLWIGRIKYGDSIDLSNTTWADHEITYWTQNDEEIAAGTTTVEIYEDTIFVANWQSTIFHNITIIPNGGTYDNQTESKTYPVREGTTFTFLEASREDGYAFEGWYTGDTVSENNKFTETEFIVTEDATFIANWFKAIARIERTQKLYPSIMAAHAEANPGSITDDIITLLVDTEEVVTNEKQITLDLGTHTVTGYLVNTANGNLTLINGEINNYTNPVIDTTNPNGAAVINNGTLTMGVNDYALQNPEDTDETPVIKNSYIRLIGTNIGLQQNATFNFYDGFIEGIIGLVGGYDDSPWYRKAYDGVVVHYFPFVTHNGTKDCQHVELSNADRAVSKTTVHGDIYYYNLQDNIDTSVLTGYQIYAVRDFDVSYLLNVPADSTIVFDIIDFTVNLGDVATIDGHLKVIDSKTGDEAGELTSAQTIVNNGTTEFKDVKVSAHTANTLIRNNNVITMTNATLSSSLGTVLDITEPNTTLTMDENSYIRDTNSSAAAITNNSTALALSSGNIISAACAVQNNSGKSLTISGGNYTSSYRTICNNNGTTNITGGHIEANGTSDGIAGVYSTNSSSLTISGGIIDTVQRSTGYQSANGVLVESYSTFKMTGGEINATSSSLTYTYGVQNQYSTFTIDGENAKINVTNTNTGNYAGAMGVSTNQATNYLKKGTITVESQAHSSQIVGGGSSSTVEISNITGTAHSTNGDAYGVNTINRYHPTTVTMTGGSLTAKTDNSSKLAFGISSDTVEITGGSIDSDKYGILGYSNGNTSTITIGTKDSTLYNGQNGIEAKPIIRGGAYALYDGNVYFYDGLLKSGIAYVNSSSVIKAIPDGTNYVIRNYTDPDEQHCWLEEDQPFLHLESNNRDYNSLSAAFADAAATDKITVTRDVSTPASISSNSKAITLELDGHTLEFSQPIPNSGTLIIKNSNTVNGTIKNTNSNVVRNSGALTLASGTLQGYDCPVQNYQNKTFKMTGGSVKSEASAICNDRGTVEITNGTVIAETNRTTPTAIFTSGGQVDISGGTLTVNNYSTNWTYGINSSNYADIKMTGGTLTVKSNTSNYVYGVNQQGGKMTFDGASTKIEVESLSDSTNTVYGVWLSNASGYIKNGTISTETNKNSGYTIGLQRSDAYITGGEITAHSIASSAYGIYGTYYYHASYIEMSAGTVTARSDDPSKTAIGLAANTIKMTGGYTYGGTDGILGRADNVTSSITIGTNDETLYNGQNGIEAKPIIKGGTYGIENGYVYFYDGVIKGGSAYANSTDIVKAIPDGTSRVVQNFTDPVEQDCWLEEDAPYLHLESDGQDYNSLTLALSRAESTDKITVIQDASTQAVLPAITKNITLELAGNTLYYSQPLQNSGSLVIQDSEGGGAIINNNSSVSTVINDGTLELKSGTIYNYSCAIQNNKNKTFTMTNGNVNSEATAICNSGGTVNINGGTIKAETSSATPSGIDTSGGSVNVTGGSIIINNNNTSWTYGINSGNYATITMTGGTITTNAPYSYYHYGIYSQGGTITLDGDTVSISVNSTNANSSYGHAVSGIDANVYIKKGTISVNLESGNAHGVYLQRSNAFITGGNITASNNTGNAYGVFGIIYYHPSSIDMSAGTINATTHNPDATAVGLAANTVKMSGGYAYGDAYGILGYSDNVTSSITLGANDGTIFNGQNGVEAKPVIVGGKYGIYGGAVSFYDGVLKGQIDAYYDRNIKAIADQSYMHIDNETIDDDEYVVKYLAGEEWLARIGTDECGVNNTRCFHSIQAAINASSEDDEIDLIADNYVFGSIQVPSEKKFTIDLNGFNIITGSYIQNNGNMTITNSKKSSSDPLIRYSEGNQFILNKTGANLTLDNLRIKSTNYTVVSETGSTTTIQNSTLESDYRTIDNSGNLTISASSIVGYERAITHRTGALTISDDSTLSAYSYTIYVESGSCAISDTAITNLSTYHYGNPRAYYQLSNITATFTRTTVNGGIYNEGTLTITDSTVNRTTDYTYPALYATNTSTTVLDKTSVDTHYNGTTGGFDYAISVYNYGDMTIRNQSTITVSANLGYMYRSIYTLINEGTLKLTNSDIKTGTLDFDYIYDYTSIGLYNNGDLTYTNSRITFTDQQTVYGLYNNSGNTVITSGNIKTSGTKAYGIWINTGAVTMGEAELSHDDPEHANVSTTTPHIEAIGSNTGFGVTMNTGSFNFYDGKILQSNNLGPAVNPAGTAEATITEVEYHYEPKAFTDDNGNTYYILTYMRINGN